MGCPAIRFTMHRHPMRLVPKLGLGFRNPFRITIRRKRQHRSRNRRSGGVIRRRCRAGIWEDLSVVTGKGQNFGWPIFEGMEPSEYAMRLPSTPMPRTHSTMAEAAASPTISLSNCSRRKAAAWRRLPTPVMPLKPLPTRKSVLEYVCAYPPDFGLAALWSQ